MSVHEEQEQPTSETNIEASAGDNMAPPAIQPPKTKAPVSFNQQNNYYQTIPSAAWDRLSQDQIVELSKRVLDHADAADQRHFEYAKERLKNSDSTHRRNIFIGSLVTLVAIAVTTYLAMRGHEVIAMTISLPLSTIIAMLLGNRLLD